MHRAWRVNKFNSNELFQHCDRQREVEVCSIVTEEDHVERYCVTAANIFNNIPILARQLDSRVLFRTHVNDLI